MFWTLHISYTDMATVYVDSISMMCIQLGVVTFLSCLAALLLEVSNAYLYLRITRRLVIFFVTPCMSLSFHLFPSPHSSSSTYHFSLSLSPSASAMVPGPHIFIFALANILSCIGRYQTQFSCISISAPILFVILSLILSVCYIICLSIVSMQNIALLPFVCV